MLLKQRVFEYGPACLDYPDHRQSGSGLPIMYSQQDLISYLLAFELISAISFVLPTSIEVYHM